VIRFVAYDPLTGAINSVFYAPQVEGNLRPGEAALVVDNPIDADKFYVSGLDSTPALAARPVMPLVFPEDGDVDVPYEITGIPEGTVVTFPGGTVMVDDGFVEWTSEVEGSFRFMFVNFPYQTVEHYAQIDDE
jgi:hypothetical protein